MEPLSFGPVAPYYDELMKTVPYRMWVGYYFLLLSWQDAHPKTVLDIACGTGTMTQMLSREGLKMTGVDLSAGMIEVARKKASKSRRPIEYFVADAAEMDLGRKFDAALSFYDSLNNITDRERLGMAFKRAAAHLNPGGSFIFDLNTDYAFAMDLFDQENMRANAKLRYNWKGEWDPETRLIRVHMRFWYQGDEFEEVHIQRAYEEDEIRELLKQAGFINVNAFSSYSLDKPRGKTDRVHYAAILGG